MATLVGVLLSIAVAYMASLKFNNIKCFLLAAGISLATRPTKTDGELTGLVYSLTPKTKLTFGLYSPAALGIAILLVLVALNIAFR